MVCKIITKKLATTLTINELETTTTVKQSPSSKQVTIIRWKDRE